MKLLQINSSVGNMGSTASDTEGIGKAALEKGWESYVAFDRCHTESSSKLVNIGNTVSFYIHVLLSRLFDAEGYGSVWGTKKLIKEIDKIDRT